MAVLAIIMSLVLACPIAGCSSSSTDEGSSTGSASEAVPDSDDGVEDEDEAAVAETEEDEAEEATLTVHFIDVGQGDSTFIELPDGKTMLIDAGPEESGRDVVSYIEDLGYTSIDYVVATHPHEDHIGGLPRILEEFEVGEVWAPAAVTSTKIYEEFLDAVEDAGLQIHAASTGKTIASEDETGYSIEVLGPSADLDSDDMNEYSAVILLEYGGTSFLITGDASADDLLEWTSGSVDVLKVAHHGSYTGTTEELASQLSPAVAVISYEKGNSYGHPHQSVLDALEEVGAEIYGTAANGTIVVTSDGSSIEVETEHWGTVKAGEGDEDDDESDDEGEDGDESTASATSELDGDTTVYVTRTGKKYHASEDCKGLENANSILETTLEEAEEEGYEPCSICY